MADHARPTIANLTNEY
jgi:hypothetical protein